MGFVRLPLKTTTEKAKACSTWTISCFYFLVWFSLSKNKVLFLSDHATLVPGINLIF